jgi:hypothetical protein
MSQWYRYLNQDRAVRSILNTPKKVKYFSKDEALHIILRFSNDYVKKRKNMRVDIDLIGTGMYGVDTNRDVLSWRSHRVSLKSANTFIYVINWNRSSIVRKIYNILTAMISSRLETACSKESTCSVLDQIFREINLRDLGVMPYNNKIVIINTAYKDTQYNGMNKDSFQSRLFFF